MEFRRVLFRSIWPRAALRCSCKLAEERARSAACRLKVIDPMPPTNFVFPVRYVSEGVAVQTTSRELSALGIAVRSLAPPQVGARVSMALYLPNTAVPEVAIARVARAKAGAPREAGVWADFIVGHPQARMRISHLPSPPAHAGRGGP